MKLKFWERETKAEAAYKKIIFLQLREKKFSKQFNDQAWQLEKKRNNGKEYCV
jgi:hypothetical protein